jgi:predicted deacylase
MSEVRDTLTNAATNAADKALTTLLDRIAQAGGSPVSDELRPLAAKYAPALVQMTAAEVFAWLDLAAANPTKAYEAMVNRLDGAGIVSEWDNLNNEWTAANRDNAEAIARRKAIVTDVATGIVRGLVKLMLPMVGV